MTSESHEISVDPVPASGVSKSHKVDDTRKQTRKLLLLLCTAIIGLVGSGLTGAFIALETQDRSEVARTEFLRVEGTLETMMKGLNLTKLAETTADFDELAKQGHTSPFEARLTSNDTDVRTARRLRSDWDKRANWNCNPWEIRGIPFKGQGWWEPWHVPAEFRYDQAAFDCRWSEASNVVTNDVSRNDPFVKAMVKHKDTLTSFCYMLIPFNDIHPAYYGSLAWSVAQTFGGGVLKPYIGPSLGNMCWWMPALKKMHTVSYQYGSWDLVGQVAENKNLGLTKSLTVGFYESKSTSETTTQSATVGAEVGGTFAKIFTFGLSASVTTSKSITDTVETGTSTSTTWTTSQKYKWIGPDSHTCKGGSGKDQELYRFVYNVVYADGHVAAYKTDHVSQLCYKCSDDAAPAECPPRHEAPAAFLNARFDPKTRGMPLGPTTPQPMCYVATYMNKRAQQPADVCKKWPYEFQNRVQQWWAVGIETKLRVIDATLVPKTTPRAVFTTHGTPAPWSNIDLDLV